MKGLSANDTIFLVSFRLDGTLPDILPKYMKRLRDKERKSVKEFWKAHINQEDSRRKYESWEGIVSPSELIALVVTQNGMLLTGVAAQQRESTKGKFTQTKFRFISSKEAPSMGIIEGMDLITGLLQARWGKLEVIRDFDDDGQGRVHIIFSNHTNQAFGTLGDPDELGIRYQMRD